MGWGGVGCQFNRNVFAMNSVKYPEQHRKLIIGNLQIWKLGTVH